MTQTASICLLQMGNFFSHGLDLDFVCLTRCRVPLDDEEAQKEEEELEAICNEWDDREAATEKEKSD